MKLLIRATNWVGDAIMALPALQAVRNKFPAVQISILALPYVADIYRGQGIADGKAYWNIHTQTFGGGEIRGFLVPVPEPSSALILGAGAMFVMRRRRDC